MERFVFGTVEQFQNLDELCHDYRRHYWPDVTLPETYKKQHVELSFFLYPVGMYEITVYPALSVYSNDSPLEKLLRDGHINFSSMDDVMNFFQSLQPLFCAEPTVLAAKNQQEIAKPITDRKRLNQIMEQKKKIVSSEEIARKLKEQIFGQNEAIETLSDYIALALMKNPRRLSVLFFAGTTGTGKSETTRQLSSILTEISGEKYDFLNVAGNELVGEFSVQRFFGAPPGYVGYSKPTVFDPIRKNPRHILAIDEIEKADPAILRGLMEVFDTGKANMADNSTPVDLSETIIILTSNIPINEDKLKRLSIYEQDEYFRDVLREHCGLPEVCSRIQKFIYFYPLNNDAKIEILLKVIADELRSYNLELTRIDEEILAELLSSETEYGVRAMRARIQEAIGRTLIKNKWHGEEAAAVSITGSLRDVIFEFSNKTNQEVQDDL